MAKDVKAVLAGDIGGTKTNLAVFSQESGPWLPLAEATFPSRDYPGIEPMIREFLSSTGVLVDIASLGVAGPVLDGRARVTNLPWILDEVELARNLGLASVKLLNDLLALASAVPLLEGEDLHILNRGQQDPEGSIAVIAPGTGLGAAYLTWNGNGYRAYPSEGGHADFAPADSTQAGLLAYMKERYGHVSWERVCSGIGMLNIYTYLKESGLAGEPAWLAEKLASASDPVPEIASAAMDGESHCGICRKTLEIFLAILGSISGNVALQMMSTGGFYLGGGIPPRILGLLENGTFMDAFLDKGRMSELAGRIPVYVILNPKAAMIGAACRGMEISAR
ncbi:MAG: glucokinase [Thermovirga sp.]